jgi:hypothetical protein
VLIVIWSGIWSAVCAHKGLGLRAVHGLRGQWRLALAMDEVPPSRVAGAATVHHSWTHRAAAAPMVVAFVTWLTLWFFIHTFSEAERLLLNSIDQSKFRPYLAWCLTPIAVEIVGLLCGGIPGSRRQRDGKRLQSCSRDS